MTTLGMVILGVLIALLTAAVHYAFRLHREMKYVRASNSAMSLMTVREYVGETHAAEVLRTAARDYDTVGAKGRMEVLARTNRHKDERVSLPALWMMDRADFLDPAVQSARIEDRAHPWRRTP